MPIFRSRHQGPLLAALLLRPDHEYTIVELAARIDAPVSTVHREVERLVAAGIIRSRSVGRTRLLSANAAARLNKPLTELVAVTYGPLTVVADEFSALDDVELVLIFGSWAARYRGASGPPPNDVDVLVVGTPARGDVYDAAERARRRLDLPVNPTISSPQRWSEARDALIQQIRSSAYVLVAGNEDMEPGR